MESTAILTTTTVIIPILTATPNETAKWETSTALTVTTVSTEQDRMMRTPMMACVTATAVAWPAMAIGDGYHYDHDQNTNYQSDGG
jgi:hypothetical protein